MEDIKTKRIENIKNILIVVLVLSTILLLYFLWGNQSIEAFIFNEEEPTYEVLDSKKVLLPEQIVLCRGNEDYTLAYYKKQEVWDDFILSTFRDFSEGTNILVEEITEEQYKIVMKYPSVVAQFDYNLPFGGFCEKYNIKQVQGTDNISNITQIGFSQGSTESTFIYDGSKQKYYRLVGAKKLGIFDQVETLFAEQDFVTYYTLKTFLGEESTNDTLIPLEIPAALPTITYSGETQLADDNVIADMAQTYFGETFDFVRKVEETNGTIIYMYGYGQKVLIVNPEEGYVEYKEETKSAVQESTTSFDALNTALSFVASHNGFETLSGQQLRPYLKSISSIGDKKNAYRFVFGINIGRNKLFYEEQMPLIMEVTDGHVSYFRREFINFNEEDAEVLSGKESVSAINMLAMNYEYMKNTLYSEEIIDKEFAAAAGFEDVANRISDFYVGYLKQKQVSEKDGKTATEDTELIPVWVVEIKGVVMYFDLYSGEPKGYSKSIK